MCFAVQVCLFSISSPSVIPFPFISSFPSPFTPCSCFAGNCGARNPLLRNNLYYPRKWVSWVLGEEGRDGGRRWRWRCAEGIPALPVARVPSGCLRQTYRSLAGALVSCRASFFTSALLVPPPAYLL